MSGFQNSFGENLLVELEVWQAEVSGG